MKTPKIIKIVDGVVYEKQVIHPVPKPVKQKKESKIAGWSRIQKELVEDFRKAGIKSCEIKLGCCTKNWLLGFAHTKKRRYITDIKRVVLACQPCHEQVEYFCKKITGKTMEEFLELIINARTKQP